MTAQPKPGLTEEELKDLADLEAGVAHQAAEDVVARKRQHLAALRMQKKLASQHGKHGLDFAVVETTAGNFAIKRPSDLEVDSFTADAKDGEERAQLQGFLCNLRLEPGESDLKTALTQFPALGNILAAAAMGMCGKRLEEEGKS